MTPREVLAARHPHGTRIRYVTGCRCVPCRAAASRYESARLAARKAGSWNGLVDSRQVLAHLRKLSRAGVGYRRAAEVAGVGKTTLARVLAGTKQRVRAELERKVLAVKPRHAAPHALVDAGPTWKRIAWLLEHGAKKAWIAHATGHRRGALQLDPRRTGKVTADNARRVKALYEFARYGRETPAEGDVPRPGVETRVAHGNDTPNQR